MLNYYILRIDDTVYDIVDEDLIYIERDFVETIISTNKVAHFYETIIPGKLF